MEWVKQRTKTDCAVAALAMVTDQTYEYVAARLRPLKRGTPYEWATDYLTSNGFATRSIRIGTPLHELRGRYVAIVRWTTYAEHPSAHLIAIECGVVFDPSCSIIYGFSQYHRVVEIIEVIKVEQ